MAGADFTAVSAALKEHYAQNVAKVLFDDPSLTPLMGILEKRAGKVDASGRKFIQAIHYGDGSGVSADFATAQAKSQGSTTGASNLYTRWEVDAKTVNGVAYWDRQVIDNIQGDSQMFDIAEEEMNGKMRGIRLDLARNLWTTGFGELGQIVSTSASPAYVTVGADVVNRFELGDDLVASSGISGAALRSTTSLAITNIDPDTNKLTLSASPGGVSWAVNDYLFRKGDRQNSTAATEQKIFGFGSWVPTSAPSSATFCAVDRSTTWKLGGLRYSGSGVAIKTALLGAANKLFQFGATKASHCFMSIADYSTLCDQLDDAKHIEVAAKQFNVSFDGIALYGAMGGTIKVLPDPFCPQGTALMGDFNDPNNAYLVYSGDLVNIDDHDGNIFLRASSATAYEARMYFHGNLVVAAPGRFIRVTSLA